MRLIPLATLVFSVLLSLEAGAGQKTVTLFLDGARVEQDFAAANGYLEVALPDNFMPGSLRVKALGGGSVLRVELVAAEQDRRRGGEIARLKERKGELQDRMSVLKRREDIFSAAAKSQSGKSPRKTKANPDPLGTLRQGTAFALNQMESVYRSKRKCQKELDEVDRRLSAAAKGVASARVWIAGGKARISYLLGDERWTPRYDLRVQEEGGGELLLHARLPHPVKGVQYRVSRGTVAQDGPAETVRGEYPTLSRYPLTLLPGSGSGNSARRFAFTAVEAGLPPGDAAVFWRGEYLGSGPFPGGGATEFSLGR